MQLALRTLQPFALIGGLLLVGCAVPQAPPATLSAAPTLTLPARFREAPAKSARSIFGTRVWWRTLGDRNLDQVVAIALHDNFTLREAGARVVAAEAALHQAKARLFPSLDASAEGSDRWSDGGDRGLDPQLTFGALLGWEVDAFGRLEAARRATAHEVQATRSDLAAAHLFISASVAEAYFGRLEQMQQHRLLVEQTEVGETLLKLTRMRFGQGLASIVDILQQEQQLKETRALEPVVQARIAELGYVLDALLGRPPGRAPRVRDATLPNPPPLPATGLPSDLLLNRPDLLAAQQRLAALDARVAEALAEKLPRFELSASSLATVGGASSFVTNLVASVVAPVFDAGSRQAEVSKRRANLDGAVADYGNRFLGALREVETALVNERHQTERLRRQETQLATAKRLLGETRNRYSQGLTAYLPVLTALTTVQQLERDVVSTRRERISQRIALHRALGGPMN